MPTVLVVDDDAAFLDSVEQLLALPGYDVVRANDGSEALRIVEKLREKIDLAIVDLALPKLNGFELIGAIARRPNSIKMIATTGVFRDSELEIAGALGAHAVIRKPPPGMPLPAREWLGTMRKLIGEP